MQTYWLCFFELFLEKCDWQCGAVRLSKNILFTYLISFFALFSVVAVFLFNPFGTSNVEAATWFNDSWGYRKRIDITVTSTATDRTGVDTLLTVDTNLGGTKLQSLCQDLRFTSISGATLPYYIPDTTSCNTNATNKIWVKVDTVPKNVTSYSIYMYYGNSLAPPGSDSNALNLVNGLAGYWKFNESSWNNDCSSSTVLDSSINSNTATSCPSTTGPTGGGTGNYANGGVLDGSNDYLEVADHSSIKSANFTVSSWFKITSLDTAYPLLLGKQNSSTDRNYALFFEQATGYVYGSSSFSATKYDISTNTNVNDTNWHNVVYTVSGTTQTIYLDGIQKNSQEVIGTTDTPTATLKFSDSGSAPFSGTIDDTRIYNRALSAQEINQLYSSPGGSPYLDNASTKFTASLASEETAPTPIAYWKFDDGQGTFGQDSSSNNLDGTLTNMDSPSSAASGWKSEDMCISGKCLQFDGSDNYVDVADNSMLEPSGDMTLSAWIYLNQTASIKGEDEMIFYKSHSVDPWYSYAFFVQSANDNLQFVWTNSSDIEYEVVGTGTALMANTWYYVVAEKSGTTLKLFVNGKEISYSAQYATSGTIKNSDSSLKIGAVESAQKRVKGKIDEAKIYASALSSDQIRANYNARSNPEGSAAVLGANNQNMPGALSNGLIGYWKMDDNVSGNGQTIIDSSGNGYNSTTNYGANTSGMSCTGAGKFNRGCNFDGTDDIVSYSNDADYIIEGQKQWTMSAWFKTTDTNAYIIDTRDDTDGTSDGAAIYTDGSSTLRIQAQNNNQTVVKDWTYSVSSTDGNWHHVTFTRDGENSFKLYFDGVLSTPSVVTTDDDFTNQTEEWNDVHFGNRHAQNIYPLSGDLDGIRLYNRALTGAEVAQLYNWAPGPIGYWKMDDAVWNGTSGEVKDSSGNGYNGTANDGATLESGKFGKAGRFDGVNDDVSVASNLLGTPSQFTISAWVNLTSRDIEGATIISVGNYFGLNADTNVCTGPEVFFYQGSSSWNQSCSSTAIDDTGWHHITGTYDGVTEKLYIDGVLKDSDVYNAPIVWTGLDTGINIGGGSGTDFDYGGLIDDVKVYNYIRTQAQIVEDMNGGHPAPGSPVGSAVAHWKFDLGYGTTAHDSNSSTGGAEDLTLSSATSAWSNSGKFGKAFNGSGSRWLTKADDDDLDFSSSEDFAISFWMNSSISSAANPAATEYIVSKAPSGATNGGYAVYANTSGQICLGIDDDNSSFPENTACTSADVYDNTWHYITAVKTGIARMEMFVDGKSNGTSNTALTATSNTLANTSTFFVASQDAVDDGDDFNGNLDELKIYRSVLTNSQISMDMNRGAAQQLGALSSTNAQPNSADAEYCIPGDSSTCTGPIGRWNFEEGTGTTAQDASGNGNTGTTTGALYKVGKVGKALNFDGVDDNVNAGSATSLDNISAKTLEAWIYPESLGESNIGKIFSKVGTGWWQVQINGEPAINFHHSFSGTDGSWKTANGTITLNAWNHIAITYDRTSTANVPRIYINGIAQSVTTETGPTGTADDDSSGSLYFGSKLDTSEAFDGSIDQVRIFNYARTPAQIAWDFNQGKPLAHWKMDECQGTTIHDSSGNGLSGTWSTGGSGITSVGTCGGSAGTAWGDGATGRVNYSMAFDGIDDKVDFGAPTSLKLTDQIGISMWVKPDSNALSSGEHAMIHNYDGGGTTAQYELTFMNGALEFNYGSSSNYVSYNPNPAVTFTAGNWYHIIFTDTGSNGTGTFYINGTKYTSTKTGSVSKPNSGNGNTVIGSNTFSGLLDDVKIFGFTLTDSQAKTIYNDGATRFGPNSGPP